MEPTESERGFLLDQLAEKRKLIEVYLRMIEELKAERDAALLQNDAIRKALAQYTNVFLPGGTCPANEVFEPGGICAEKRAEPGPPEQKRCPDCGNPEH
jgi:hypothetical protein